MVGGEVGAGGGATVQGVVTGDQGLFVGGPKHGQVLPTYGSAQTVVALDWVDWTGRDEDGPGDRQVHYSRRKMLLELDGRTHMRPVWWSGQGNPSQEMVADALLQAWFRTSPTSWTADEARQREVDAGRARGGTDCCGSTGVLHRWFCVTSPVSLRERAPVD